MLGPLCPRGPYVHGTQDEHEPKGQMGSCGRVERWLDVSICFLKPKGPHVLIYVSHPSAIATSVAQLCIYLKYFYRGVTSFDQHFLATKDPFYNYSFAVTSIESNITIIAACIPGLKALTKRLNRRRPSSSGTEGGFEDEARKESISEMWHGTADEILRKQEMGDGKLPWVGLGSQSDMLDDVAGRRRRPSRPNAFAPYGLDQEDDGEDDDIYAAFPKCPSLRSEREKRPEASPTYPKDRPGNAENSQSNIRTGAIPITKERDELPGGTSPSVSESTIVDVESNNLSTTNWYPAIRTAKEDGYIGMAM
jgi:hypothetical protein